MRKPALPSAVHLLAVVLAGWWEPTFANWDGVEDRSRRTTPVGCFPAGHGHTARGIRPANVWEWCLDTWKPEPGKPVPPRAPKGELKVFKGGGWNQDADFAAAPNRFMMSPTHGIHFVGFRIVLAEGVAK